MQGTYKQVATLENDETNPRLQHLIRAGADASPHGAQLLPDYEVEPLIPTSIRFKSENTDRNAYNEVKRALRESMWPAPVAYSSDSMIYENVCLVHWSAKHGITTGALNSIMYVKKREDVPNSMIGMQLKLIQILGMKVNDEVLVSPKITFAKQADELFGMNFNSKKN